MTCVVALIRQAVSHANGAIARVARGMMVRIRPMVGVQVKSINAAVKLLSYYNKIIHYRKLAIKPEQR